MEEKSKIICRIPIHFYCGFQTGKQILIEKPESKIRNADPNYQREYRYLPTHAYYFITEIIGTYIPLVHLWYQGRYRTHLTTDLNLYKGYV